MFKEKKDQLSLDRPHPQKNQRKGCICRLTCDLSLCLSATLTTPGLLSAILMFQHRDMSINSSG